jgi:hypothetical protein
MAESNPSLSIIKIERSDSALWNQFVEDSPQGTFFHTTIWTDILSQVFSRSYEIVMCMKKDQPVGGMIHFKHRKLIWNVITPTAFFPYCAPIFYQPTDEKPQKTIHNLLAINAEFDNYLKKNYDYWILDVPATSKDVRSYLWAGAVVEPHYSYVVPLRDKEKLYANYNQSVRKKLKQAEEHNVTIEESTDGQAIRDLVSKSYHRHGMKPLVSEEQLEAFLIQVLQLEQAKLFYLKEDNKIIAGRLIIIDNISGYDLLAGSDDSIGYGSTYLMTSIFDKYTGKINQFDFLGADHPQIERFKRGFGGELTHGFRITNKIKFPLSWIINLYRYQKERDRIL